MQPAVPRSAGPYLVLSTLGAVGIIQGWMLMHDYGCGGGHSGILLQVIHRTHEDTGSSFTACRSPEFRSPGTLEASRCRPPRPCGPCTALETRLTVACCDPPGRRPPSVPLPLGGHVSAAACSVLRPSWGCAPAPGAVLPSCRHLPISLRHHGRYALS